MFQFEQGLFHRQTATEASQLAAGSDQTVAGDNNTQGIGMGRVVTFGRMEKPNDGTVVVSDTAASGISATYTAPVSHFGMLFNREIAAQVCHFLREGSFERR